ncbi:hypothetical protein [Mycobacterium sp. MS1601]|uniref:hypothetical protein n=1 Tax=Mycobacterium sp. MS1601 TaxID=1936029 RepID=UPI0012F78805|nr:hypothetical protein [Mycobacterium sp. MS1601]
MPSVNPEYARPAWAADASLRTIWVAADEPPEWISGRVDALLTTLQSSFGIGG